MSGSTYDVVVRLQGAVYGFGGRARRGHSVAGQWHCQISGGINNGPRSHSGFVGEGILAILLELQAAGSKDCVRRTQASEEEATDEVR